MIKFQICFLIVILVAAVNANCMGKPTFKYNIYTTPTESRDRIASFKFYSSNVDCENARPLFESIEFESRKHPKDNKSDKDLESADPIDESLNEMLYMMGTQGKMNMQIYSESTLPGYGVMIRGQNGRVVGFSTDHYMQETDAKKIMDQMESETKKANLEYTDFNNNKVQIKDNTEIKNNELKNIYDLSYVQNTIGAQSFDSEAEMNGFRRGNHGLVSSIQSLRSYIDTTMSHEDQEPMTNGLKERLSRRLEESTENRTQIVWRNLAEKLPWDGPDNDPARFKIANINYNFGDYEKKGWNKGECLRKPWPDTYWPTHQDGALHRWQQMNSYKPDLRCSSQVDCLSPLEKYDIAFNNWPYTNWIDTMNRYNSLTCPSVSWNDDYYYNLGPAGFHHHFKGNQGNYICHNHHDDSGNGQVDECTSEGCEFLVGGRPLIAKWFGLCHQWCPSSIMFAEPETTVSVQSKRYPSGVEFQVSDIKALLMLNNYKTHLLGTRCNIYRAGIPFDSFGRIAINECRSLNAGGMHIVLANLMGRDKRALLMDRDVAHEVWNHPILEFKSETNRINNHREACQWLGGCEGDRYSWNSKAKKWVSVYTLVNWMNEAWPSRFTTSQNIPYYTSQSQYQYLLELDADDNIIGGEWRFGILDHPDFFWIPYEVDEVPFNRGVKPEELSLLHAASLINGTSNIASVTDSEGNKRKYMKPVSEAAHYSAIVPLWKRSESRPYQTLTVDPTVSSNHNPANYPRSGASPSISPPQYNYYPAPQPLYPTRLLTEARNNNEILHKNILLGSSVQCNSDEPIESVTISVNCEKMDHLPKYVEVEHGLIASRELLKKAIDKDIVLRSFSGSACRGEWKVSGLSNVDTDVQNSRLRRTQETYDRKQYEELENEYGWRRRKLVENSYNNCKVDMLLILSKKT